MRSMLQGLDAEAWAVLVVVALLLLLALVLAIQVGPAFVRAKVLGLDLSLQDAIGIRLRKSCLRELVAGLHLAKKNGLPISADQIEVQMLAGGEALGCVRALCRAKELGEDADWDTIATIDLAGADVERVVESDFDLRTFVGGADPGGRKEGLRKRPT